MTGMVVCFASSLSKDTGHYLKNYLIDDSFLLLVVKEQGLVCGRFIRHINGVT